MKLVLDSSVIVKFFLQESLSDKARALLVAIGEGAHEAHIPSLACYEVLGVLSQHLATQDEIGRHLSSLYNLIDSNAIRMHLVKQRLLNKAAEIACTDTHDKDIFHPTTPPFMPWPCRSMQRLLPMTSLTVEKPEAVLDKLFSWII